MSTKLFEVDESPKAAAVHGHSGEPIRFSRYVVDHNVIVPFVDDGGFHGLAIKGKTENSCVDRTL